MTPTEGPAGEVVLRLDGITKRFGGLVANDAISLTLRAGEVVALLGENGAGKTTLMNILFGHYLADQGSVTVFGKPLPPGQPRAALQAGVGMVHQHFTLADNLTVLENIRLGTEPLLSFRGAGAARARVLALAQDFGLAVHPDARLGSLSVGERQRIEILKALYRNARILILDEPTAVLTPQESDALFATLKKATARGLSIIFISHKLQEVMAVADRCIVLRQGRVVGEVETRGTSRAGLAAMMVGETLAEAKVAPGPGGPVRLGLAEVSAPGLHRVSLELRGGTITGLAGVSGNGQAALADLIGGALAPLSGRIEVDGNRPSGAWTPQAAIGAGVGRIPEDRHKTGTVADFTLAENTALETYRSRFARRGVMDWRAVRAHARSVIDGYDVRCEGPDQRIRLLSGGNMQKLILGRVMEEAPGILIANQPVRGLDVGAIAYVHARLVAARDAGAAVLLISEDLDEITGLSDVIHVISAGRLSRGFARGELTQAGIGLLMAGQGFEHAA